MYIIRERYRFTLDHVAKFKANYLAEKNQEAQAKKTFKVMKQQKNEPPVNHGDQGLADDVSDDRVRKTIFTPVCRQGLSPTENTFEVHTTLRTHIMICAFMHF